MCRILPRLLAFSALMLSGCESVTRVAEVTMGALKAEIVAALSDEGEGSRAQAEWPRQETQRPVVEPSITRPAEALAIEPLEPTFIDKSQTMRPQALIALATGSTLAPNARATWSFRGDVGPENWATLDPSFQLCGAGLNQSPIELAAAAPAELPELQFHYSRVPTSIANDGRSIYVQPNPGLWLDISGMRYDLVEIQLRSPGEHSIDDRRAAMEIQLIHQNIHGQIAVVAVLVEKGDRHAGIEAVALAQPPRPQPGDPLPSTSLHEFELDPNQLLPPSNEHFRYSGSMTVPPCQEGVAWHVMTTPIEAAQADIEKLAANMARPNGRNLQALNGRQVSRSIAMP